MDGARQHITNPLTRKLTHFVPLSDDDRAVLDQLTCRVEGFEVGRDLAVEGEAPRAAFVLLEGMACRYRIMPDGRRQIMTFLLPGDLCGLHAFLFKAMDHSIGTLTPGRLAAISQHEVMQVTYRHPRVSIGLWWSTLQEEAMLRERIVALGRRDARQRVAYLLCELVWRYRAIGGAEGNTISLPLTQSELADTLGLTAVHVNRVLQDLRREKLLELRGRTLTLLDADALSRGAGFNGSYLHLGSAPDMVRRYFEEAK